MIGDNDFFVTTAPMKKKLKLKGHALDLFAIIYGFSKDGESTCRASLAYFAEWLETDKALISKTLKKLVDAGYINRLEYLRGDMKCYEYTSNYGAMLAKAERGEEMGLKSAKSVVKNTTVVKTTKKGCQNDNESVVKTTTNNIYNNIYNIFSCASPAQQEEEKKVFYKNFFFRNAADPAVEVDKFIAYNETNEWRNEKGRVYDTPEKRAALATLWSFKEEGQWARPDYLEVVKNIYESAVEDGIEGVEAIINHKVTIKWDGKMAKWIWTATPEAREWIERNNVLVRLHLAPMVGRHAVSWNIIK